MPVEGLPITLETMLNGLLQEMALSSFKIEGRGKQTVVVLRLTESVTKITDQPPLAVDHSVAAYRRKSLSQANRDRRRADAYRMKCEAKAANEHGSSPSGLFLPTPPGQFSAAGLMETEVSEAEKFVCGNRPPPSAAQSPDDSQHGKLDLIQSDTDTQTVTLFPNNVTNMDELYFENNETSVCKNENMTVHATSCANDSPRTVDSFARDSAFLEPHQENSCQENLSKEIMAALSESMKNMDNLCRQVKEVREISSDICKTVKNGNPSDVS